MNYTKYIKTSLFIAMLVFVGGGLSSCEDDIDLGNADSSALEGVNGVYVSLNNIAGQRAFQNIDVYTNQLAEATINVCATRKVNEIVDCKVILDQALVNEYNAKNETNFEMYPAELITFENEGNIAIVPGDKISYSIAMTVNPVPKSRAVVETGKSYLLPLSLTTSTEGVHVRADKQSYIYVIKIQGDRPNPAKDSGVKTVMYFEVNDTNILNAGEWTLKKSGKPLADNVCIFAANINYNADEGRVYLKLNDNVSALLNNRDHYIKPLQDMGIKVTMSVLGDHDAAGVANLSAATCKAFAKEIKAAVDAYGLDGIEFDDEYSEYRAADGIPGFVYESSDAYARLCYECKMLMPDKIIGVYHYGYAGFSNQIEGMDPGDFVDYTYEAYYGWPNFSIAQAYRGMSKKQNAPYSRKISGGLSFSSSIMETVRDEYGVNMLYNYQTSQVSQYINEMSNMTKILYDEDCVYGGTTHPKDY